MLLYIWQIHICTILCSQKKDLIDVNTFNKIDKTAAFNAYLCNCLIICYASFKEWRKVDTPVLGILPDFLG